VLLICAHLNRANSIALSREPSRSISRALNSRLPERLRGPGTLFLWLRGGLTLARVLRGLDGAGWRYRQVDSCVRIALLEGEAQVCVGQLVDALSGDELSETRALLVAGQGEPQLTDFGNMTTLHALDVASRSGWLLDQLAEGRFTSYFHPIVDARDTSHVFAHEALLRGVERDGSLVAPEPILTLAREAGLLLEVDSAACLSAIREAGRHGPEMCVFINFSPAAIEDPGVNLREMVSAIDEAAIAHDRIVFEVVEADRFTDSPHLEAVLEGYRSAGFRVALDDLGAGWSTLNLVHRLRPDFIKLDRELISGVHLDPVKQLIAGKLLEIGSGLGISTIVEGVEKKEELDWCQAQGADFVQGFLFGKPSHTPLHPRS
jgi:EAL domain-containing protein (putative c-di-GMP-specific phosphodiesterase class I)